MNSRGASTSWRLLLERAIRGLEAIGRSGAAVPEWRLGGGTALMLSIDHRVSHDIDLFLDDPQYLAYISPRAGGENVWLCDGYDEAGNFLKLAFPEGQIDFIVAGKLSSLADSEFDFEVGKGCNAERIRIRIEHPIEIAVKKLFYRGANLTVRDAFDVSAVHRRFRPGLNEQLGCVSERKPAILSRLRDLDAGYFRTALADLAIKPAWSEFAEQVPATIGEVARSIPDPV